MPDDQDPPEHDLTEEDLTDPAGEPLSVADHATGRTRRLARQCRTCVFRPGNLMHLEPGRLKDLVAQTLARQSYVVCHETLPGVAPDTKPAICRGFADRYSTNALRVIARLWGFVDVEPPEHSPFTPPPDQPPA